MGERTAVQEGVLRKGNSCFFCRLRGFLSPPRSESILRYNGTSLKSLLCGEIEIRLLILGKTGISQRVGGHNILADF